jgi:uncharacterized protein (TIGR02118 family)
MIRLTFCLRRLPHLSRDEFQQYWRQTHGPLVRRLSTALSIRKYVQLHTVPTSFDHQLRRHRGSPEEYDGVAELWWESFTHFAASGSTPEGRDAGHLLLEDERRFIDLPRSPLWFGEEHVLIDDQIR